MAVGNGSGNSGDEAGGDYPRGPLLRPTRWWRETIFLAGNLIAYAFVNAFVHFLGSGQWLSRSPVEYQQWASRSLGEMLLSPLSIFTHPWMILVAGLLLSAIIIVPLLVSCLYHSRVCALFLVCVAVLAHAPILTLVLSLGCVLVAATDLRRRNPFLALMLGLLPVIVYLYFSARPPGIVLLPMQRLVLALPFVGAALGAMLAGAVVLLIAHWVRYRPGVIWPVVVVLAALPVAVFHQQVGADELAFSILTGQLTGSESMFSDDVLRRESGFAYGLPTPAEISRARGVLAQRKADWIARCDAFCRDYPESERTAAVLWIKGITQDTQVSVQAMYDGYLRYYDDFPLEGSADTWRELTDRFGGDPRAAIGHLRLAHLDGRSGRIDDAQAHLDAAAEALVGVFAAVPTSRDAMTWIQLFEVTPQWPSRSYLQRVALDVAKLRWLIDANGAQGDPASIAALQTFIALDRRRHSRDDFNDAITDMATQLVDTAFADNVLLIVAMNNPDIYGRARQLLQLEDESDLDASIEANFELGRLALQAVHDERLSRLLGQPERYFRRVTDAETNPWQRQAAEHLSKLRPPEEARL